MKIVIDTDTERLTVEGPGGSSLPLYSDAAFEILSALWTKVGWNQKHSYGFSWFGRPIIQLPSDIVRVQEVIHRLQPDVIVETGIAHGGSLILYASLCKALGRGRVVGIDVEIRPANRAAIEGHPLGSLVTLVEGDSTSPAVVGRVRALVQPGERVLVLLDSDHSRAHVTRELEAYHDLVTPGSYIVATDGIMRDLHDTPRGSPQWRTDNPASAAEAFAARHPEFELGAPTPLFDERSAPVEVTHWGGGWLRRRDDIVEPPAAAVRDPARAESPRS
jgi:cephalosporin hydroxylase